MHLADLMELPDPYRPRPYRGRADHPAMAEILGAYRRHAGEMEMPTTEQMDVGYAHLTDCDPETDIVLIDAIDGDDAVSVGYCRVSFEDLGNGYRDCILFSPLLPQHIGETLFRVLADAQEQHMTGWAAEAPPARYRAYAGHPGPDRPATGEARWLEDRGFEATEWGAALVRPHLDDIPERKLPDGVEMRPATPETTRQIWAAHSEAFRGEWDYKEETEDDYLEYIEDPHCDISLWKIAWAGDEVVGQVKSYINTDENAEMGYRRGYTEYISTHADWRGRGIAGALLAASLHELRERGMTEAALGVDTNNPGGAFQLYIGLGFVLQSYGAVYMKPIS